jgi:hypothetical protein
MKVFVSSTCFDLLDLRAELEAHLREMGLVPILSDRASSDFEVQPAADSIETCLANVRASDVFICILSQRYGTPLGRAGFKDVSATHLEWEEAKAQGKPIYLYVRDRTEGEFGVWKKNGAKIDVRWVQDRRLFEFLDEHRKLVAGTPSSNWFWTYRDSVDLKARVSADLRGFSSKALLLKWLETGRVPVLRGYSNQRQGAGPGRNTFTVSFAARGTVPALGARVSFTNGQAWEPLGDVVPGHDVTKRVEYTLPDEATPFIRDVLIEYRTDFGAVIEDTFRAEIPREGADLNFELVRKRLVKGLGFELA